MSGMYRVELESPPMHHGDPLVALTLLMQMVCSAPFHLRVREYYHPVYGRMMTSYQAWL